MLDIVTANKRVLELINNITYCESFFKQKLEENEIKFIFQYLLIEKNFYYIADFYLPKIRTIIEIDGYTHDNEVQHKKDKKKDSYYLSKNFNIIRIKNKDVFNYNYSLLFKKHSNKNQTKKYI